MAFDLLKVMKAISEETRLRVLNILAEGEFTVSELTEILGQSQPRVSRHLRLMCDVDLLQRYQEGTWVFYRISDDHEVMAVANAILQLIPRQQPPYSRDQIRRYDIKSRNARLAERYFADNAKEWDKIRQYMVADTEIEQLMLNELNQPKVGTLLDFGTGTGRMLEIFAPHTSNGLGIDQSRDMLNLARVNLDKAGLRHCQVRHGDITNLDFPDANAEVVIIHQVLHYLDNPEQVIHEAARLLQSKGQLMVVDFLPHDLEFLRSEHAHRRLGIDAEAMSKWCRNGGLQLSNFQTLSQPISDQQISDQQTQLQVGLWNFIKP